MRNLAKWQEILSDNVTFTLPITPYRFFHKKDIKEGCRKLSGIDAIISDTASVTLMLESIGLGSNQWKEAVIRSDKMIILYL